MIKRISFLAVLIAVATAMMVMPAGAAKKKSSKPAKAYWYSTAKSWSTGDFAAHVSATNAGQFDYMRVDAGCKFYRGYPVPGVVKLKKNKFSVDTTLSAYSNKDKVNTTITVKINGKFSKGKLKGTYTISDPSTECTDAQKAEHKFSAAKRDKQVGG